MREKEVVVGKRYRTKYFRVERVVLITAPAAFKPIASCKLFEAKTENGGVVWVAPREIIALVPETL